MQQKTKTKKNRSTGEKTTVEYWDHNFDLPRKLDGSRNRKHVTGSTEREARAKEAKARREYERSGLVPNPKMTVDELAMIWLRAVLPAQTNGNTAQTMNNSVRTIRKYIGSVKVTELSVRHVDEMFRECDLAQASMRKILGHLRKMLRWAMVRDHVHRNIAELVDPPVGRSAETEALSYEETDKFLVAIHEHPNKLFWLTLVSLGLRFSEGLGLLWSNVDLQEGVLQVRTQARRNGLDNSIELTEVLKTKASVRNVVLSSAMVELFAMHHASQKDRPNPRGLVFPTGNGSVRDHRNMSRELSKLGNQAGIVKLSPNVLRRTVCSHLVDQGMDLVRVASLLGHSDIRTAQKYYLKKMRTAEDCSVGRTALLIQQMKNSNEGVGTQMARSNQILDLSDLVKSETPCVTGGFDGAPAQI